MVGIVSCCGSVLLLSWLCSRLPCCSEWSGILVPSAGSLAFVRSDMHVWSAADWWSAALVGKVLRFRLSISGEPVIA
jgi:hypothetical protein